MGIKRASPPQMRCRRRLLLQAFCFTFLSNLALGQTQDLSARIKQPVDETRWTVLKGNTHPSAKPQFDLGTASASLPLERMLLVLKRSPEQEATLHELLSDQQNRSSTNFHHWLTPGQFGSQLGPSDTDLQAVSSWLRSHGFAIVSQSRGRTIIEFSGTAGQVRDTFHTEIHKYLVNEEEHWANSSDPEIPSALSPVVAGIVSLHNFGRKPQHYVARFPSSGGATQQRLAHEPIARPALARGSCGL